MPSKSFASKKDDPLPPSSVRLKRAMELWIQDNKAQGFSPNTTAIREWFMSRFLWWLEHEKGLPNPALDDLNPALLRELLVYVREANPSGRFGNAAMMCRREAKPATVHRWFRELRTLFNFCVSEGLMDDSPMEGVKAPRLSKEQITPFSEAQVNALLAVVETTREPERNRAILLLLLDTGLRVSELCALSIGDVGLTEIRVRGKGNKVRSVYLGKATRRTVQQYLRKKRQAADAADPLFVSGGNKLREGEGLTDKGVQLMMKRIGMAAKMTGVKCAPHTLRHTFAVNFLRSGGNLFELQQLMGHESLTVLRRYVKLAESDLAEAHRKASPVERMGIKK